MQVDQQQIILIVLFISMIVGISQFVKGTEQENLQNEKLIRLNIVSTKILKQLYNSEDKYSFERLLSCKKRIDILECYTMNPKQFINDQIECIKQNIVFQLNFIDQNFKKEIIDLINPDIQMKLKRKFPIRSEIHELKQFVDKLKNVQINDIIYQSFIYEGISIDQYYFINLLKDIAHKYKNIKKNHLTCEGDDNLRKFKSMNNFKLRINIKNLNKNFGKNILYSQYETTLISKLVNKLKDNNDYDTNVDSVIRKLYYEKFNRNSIEIKRIYELIQIKEGVTLRENVNDDQEQIQSVNIDNQEITMSILQALDKSNENISKKVQRKNEEFTAEKIPWSIKLIKDWKRMSIIMKNEHEIALFLNNKKKLFGNDFSEELFFQKERVIIRIQEIKNGFYDIKSDEESGNYRDVKIIYEVLETDLDMAFFIECQLNLENLIKFKKVDHILYDFERAKEEFEIIKFHNDRFEWMESNTRIVLQILRIILIIIAISSIGISLGLVLNDVNLRLRTIWHANLNIEVKFIESNYPNNICYSINNQQVNCVGNTKISSIIQKSNIKKFTKLISNGESIFGIDSQQKFIKYQLDDQNEIIITDNIYDIKQNNNLICQSNKNGISCIHKKIYPNIISAINRSSCISANNKLECQGDGDRAQLEIPLDFLSGADKLSAGVYTNCASKSNLFLCWGPNFFGIEDIPVQFKEGVDMFSVGFQNACAKLNDQIKCWGEVWIDNDQTEYEYVNLDIIPTEIKSGVEQLRIGCFNACALRDGKLYCWGLSAQGINDIPTEQKESISIFAISIYQVCAYNSILNCWGIDDQYISDIPIAISNNSYLFLLEMSMEIICASSESLLRCWGEGQARYSREFDIPEYQQNGVDQLAVGAYHICLSQNNSIGCQGFWNFGIYDLSDAMQQNWSVPSLDYKITNVYHCDRTFCIFKGTLLCYSLINNIISPILTPKDMINISNVLVTDEGSICGKTNNGKLVCWNLLDDERFEFDQSNTDMPSSFLSGTSHYSLGWTHICASTEDFTDCWGDNSYGQTDVPEFLVSGVTTLASYQLLNCASTLNKLQCWGSFFQYDLIDPPDELTNGVDQVDVGANFICTLKSKRAGCWGQNEQGQLDIPDEQKNDKVEVLSVGALSVCLQMMSHLRCQGSLTNHVPKQLESNGVERMSSCGFTKCGVQNGEWDCWGAQGLPMRIKITEHDTYDEVLDFNMTSEQDICMVQQDGIECKSDKLKYEHQSVQKTVYQEFMCMQVYFSIPYICQVHDRSRSTFSCFISTTYEQKVVYEQTGDSKVVKISCGTNHGCAMFESGEVHCFGGSYEQNEASLPDQMKIGAQDIRAGQNSTCILYSTQIICIGKNIDTQKDGQFQFEQFERTR